MKKLLVLQHVPYEPLGTLNPLLKSAGFRIRYINFSRKPELRPRLGGYDGLVVLGGPMSVLEQDKYPHLATELDLIRNSIDRDIPVLGICLGAQLLARSLGADVTVCRRKEIGWYPIELTPAGQRDSLLGHLQTRDYVFQWHSDTFDIPAGAEPLAWGAGCRNQAFRYGDRVYGFQFHLEVDTGLIERWLTVPAHRREMQAMSDTVDADRIRRETQTRITRLQQVAARVFSEFTALFGKVRRPHRHLPSR